MQRIIALFIMTFLSYGVFGSLTQPAHNAKSKAESDVFAYLPKKLLSTFKREVNAWGTPFPSEDALIYINDLLNNHAKCYDATTLAYAKGLKTYAAKMPEGPQKEHLLSSLFVALAAPFGGQFIVHREHIILASIGVGYRLELPVKELEPYMDTGHLYGHAVYYIVGKKELWKKGTFEGNPEAMMYTYDVVKWKEFIGDMHEAYDINDRFLVRSSARKMFRKLRRRK